MLSKNQPLFEPTANKNCRYKIMDNFFRFWFRFIYKYQYLIQVRMFDELKNLVLRDYEVFSGIALERYFHAKFIEEHSYTHLNGWWDRRGETEIDLVGDNEFKETLDQVIHLLVRFLLFLLIFSSLILLLYEILKPMKL